ncbi:hypothetical protein [Aquimarina algiphila]|nr:hypothetical protein [Aquimarina algiphila]
MNNKIQDPAGAHVFGYNGEYSSSFNFQNINTYNPTRCAFRKSCANC